VEKQQRNGAREKETQEVELGKAAVTNTHTQTHQHTHSDIKKPSKIVFFLAHEAKNASKLKEIHCRRRAKNEIITKSCKRKAKPCDVLAQTHWHTRTHRHTHTQAGAEENAATTHRRKDKNIQRCPHRSRRRCLCRRRCSGPAADVYPSAAATAQLNALLAPLTFHERQFLFLHFVYIISLLLTIFSAASEARCFVCCRLLCNFSECFSIIRCNFFPFKWGSVCAAGRIVQEYSQVATRSR